MTVNQKKLEELCKPVIEYLTENCDPYVEITITSEHIKVRRDIMSIPTTATEHKEQPLCCEHGANDFTLEDSSGTKYCCLSNSTGSSQANQ